MELDRDLIVNSIANGATLSDLAAQHNCSFQGAADEVDRLQIQRPNANQRTPADQMIAQYLGLIEEGSHHASPEELVRGPAGSVAGLPPSFSINQIKLNPIYEYFHGEAAYTDPYNGQLVPDQRVMAVNPSDVRPDQPRNFLITNIESLSKQTIEQRFCPWMRPIRETFDFMVSERSTIQLTIQRPYDKLVGGTYAQIYLEHLFERWVGGPLAQYGGKTSPESEPVFMTMSPFETAWWAWQQLTHAGLLKGLIEIKVSRYDDGRSAILRDDDVQNTMLGFLLKEKGESSLVLTNQMPRQKFAPGTLLPGR